MAAFVYGVSPTAAKTGMAAASNHTKAESRERMRSPPAVFFFPFMIVRDYITSPRLF
jgi:hypothetical protein